MEKAVAYVCDAHEKYEALQRAYDLITKRFHGTHVRTYIELWKLWPQNAASLWQKTGFMHCTNQNYLLGTLLTLSGHFKPADIKTQWTTLYLIFPHQYMRIHLEPEKIVNVDPWAHAFHIPLGDHAHGFHGSGTK